MSNSNIEISLLISAYNAANSLSSCLESAINQDFDNYEVVVINDGSTDNTNEICLEYAAKSDKIRYFSIENGGVSHARNLAVEKSKGRYIAFSDADDVFAPQYLSFMYKLIKEYDANMVITDTFRGKRDLNFEPFFSDDTQILDWPTLFRKKFQTHRPQHQVYGKLIKREIVESVKFPEGHTIEDYYVFPEYCYVSQEIVYNPSKLYLYCLNNTDSIMRTSAKSEAFLKDQLLAHKQWMVFFADKDIALSNRSCKSYLEKLFSAYGLVENGLVDCDRDSLLAYIKAELDATYRYFFDEVKSLETISKARLYFLIRPKYFIMKHSLPLVKYRYKDYYQVSNNPDLGGEV